MQGGLDVLGRGHAMPSLLLGQTEAVTDDTLKLQQAGLPEPSSIDLDDEFSHLMAISGPVTSLTYQSLSQAREKEAAADQARTAAGVLTGTPQGEALYSQLTAPPKPPPAPLPMQASLAASMRTLSIAQQASLGLGRAESAALGTEASQAVAAAGVGAASTADGTMPPSPDPRSVSYASAAGSRLGTFKQPGELVIGENPEMGTGPPSAHTFATGAGASAIGSPAHHIPSRLGATAAAGPPSPTRPLSSLALAPGATGGLGYGVPHTSLSLGTTRPGFLTHSPLETLKPMAFSAQALQHFSLGLGAVGTGLQVGPAGVRGCLQRSCM